MPLPSIIKVIYILTEKFNFMITFEFGMTWNDMAKWHLNGFSKIFLRISVLAYLKLFSRITLPNVMIFPVIHEFQITLLALSKKSKEILAKLYSSFLP